MGTTKITGFGFCMLLLAAVAVLTVPLHAGMWFVAPLCGLLGGRYGTSFD